MRVITLTDKEGPLNHSQHFRRVELTDEQMQKRYQHMIDVLGYSEEEMEEMFPNLANIMKKSIKRGNND